MSPLSAAAVDFGPHLPRHLCGLADGKIRKLRQAREQASPGLGSLILRSAAKEMIESGKSGDVLLA